ncbi:MAG TPA: gliding motility-associated C-terminal domain-containing protein, partial [Saprospiraceae bacterium]|nr:gliding motility-associated C-terminal domain-containing protein [Saprospiraceae bacterium]
GLQVSDADWTVNNGKAELNNKIPVLLAGETINVDITMTVSGSVAGVLVNKAEINTYDDDNDLNTPVVLTDIDSSPDGDVDNDAFGGDDEINNNNGDEDDADVAEITVTTTPVFDLAMIKTLALGQSANVQTGDNVIFTLTVINQGDVPAYNVELTDYVPAGLQLADADWSLTGSKAKLKTLIPLILPGFTESVDITFKVTATQPGSITNLAEISKADDDDNPNTPPVLTDQDSKPDDVAGNDVFGGNDVTDNSNGDEDDQDSEVITIGGICPTVLVDVPADKTIECNDTEVYIPANVSVSSCCTYQLTFKEVYVGGQCANSFVLKRTWTAVDNCGVTTSRTQILTVKDTKAPVIYFNNPNYFWLSNGDTLKLTCGNEPEFTADDFSTDDNCDAAPKMTFKKNLLATASCNKLIKYVVSSTDECFNVSTFVLYIEVEDITAPEIQNCPGDLVLNCNDAIPDPDFVFALDNCDNSPTIDYTETIVSGNCPQEYTIVRTWVASDHCGNASTCIQNITVQDKSAPVISLAGITDGQTITVDCSSNPVQYTAADFNVSDDCDSDPIIDLSLSSLNGNCITDGYTRKDIYTFTATDHCGNGSVFTVSVLVKDTKAPVISNCPSDIKIECDQPIPSPSNLSVSDNCDLNVAVTVSEQTIQGSCPQTKIILRTYTATDDCGNIAKCTQKISVSDTHPPVISGVPADVSVECTVPAVALVKATDVCDPNPALVFNETIPSGKCPYTVTRKWTATDACGNVSTKTQIITVKDNTAPVISGVPANVTVECAAIPLAPSLKATDVCDANPSLGFNETVETGKCPYTIIRKWTATDACGNITVKTQIITVIDNTAPVISGVPADITIDITKGGVVPGVPAVSLSDNCDKNISLIYTVSSDTSNCIATMIRKWTATDLCGNTTVKTQKLTLLLICGCVEPEVCNVKINHSGCGLNNGTAEIVICNGVNNYDFAWLPNQGTSNNAGNIKTNLPPGNYTVIVSSKTGQNCFKKVFVTVKELAENIVPEKQLTVVNPDCSKDANICLGISMANVFKFDIYDNGIKYTGQVKPCDIDTVLSYSYATIPGLGNSGPYVLESWLINGNAKTGEFANIKDLVSLLNVLDPQGNWILSSSTLSITGGKKGNVYGQIKVKQKNAGGKATMDISKQQVPHGSSFSLATGSHKLVFVHKTLVCSDTVNIKVNCIQSTEVNVIVGVGKTKKICIDNSQLPGTPVSMVNVCGNLSGEFSTLSMNNNTYCIDITGVEVGDEKACIIVCDNLGYCDTTYINIKVNTTGNSKPNANDDNITIPKGKSEIIRILGNDSVGDGYPEINLISKPDKAYVFIENNSYINIDLDKDNCEPIAFEYELCTKYGCDTATVYVNIACADLVFNNGISPNEDGANETFVIDGIDKYPNNKLTIYNRWGSEVLSQTGYKNDWKAEWEGKILPDGTYFYIFQDGEGHKYSGYVQVNR